MNQPILPNLFDQPAQRAWLASNDGLTAQRLTAEVLMRTCERIGYDPSGRNALRGVNTDHRFRAAVAIAVPLSMRPVERADERLQLQAARLRRTLRERGSGGLAGMAGRAAELLTSALIDPARDAGAVLARALGLAIDAEVLHATTYGEDAAAARAAAEMRVLQTVSDKRETRH